MKSLLVVLLAIASMSAFSNILEVNSTNDEIRDAIIMSLQSNDLDCKGTHEVKASSLLISNIFKGNYTVKISEDRSQPVITMERLGGKNKNVIVVTTDNDFKVVTRLVLKSYDNLRWVRVNVGTILEPIFKEELREGKPFEDLVCE
jgi:hypothetical protein